MKTMVTNGRGRNMPDEFTTWPSKDPTDSVVGLTSP